MGSQRPGCGQRLTTARPSEPPNPFSTPLGRAYQEDVEAQDELAVAVEELEDAVDDAGRVDALRLEQRRLLRPHHNVATRKVICVPTTLL